MSPRIPSTSILQVLLFLSVSSYGSGCRAVQPESESIILVQGPYLGQPPPGLTPLRFGPPAVLSTGSWFYHSSPSFSPDGMQMYWAKYVQPGSIELAFTEATDRGWSSPRAPSFAQGDGENQPSFSPDGNSILYVSTNASSHLLRVTRNGSEWSAPQSLGPYFPPEIGRGWQFSMAADGSVYVDGDLRSGNSLDLFRFPWTGNGFGPPVSVPVNTAYTEFAPCVAPDESYLIFTSNRPGGFGMHDLWIVFSTGEGTWSDPLNMGASINTSGEDAMPQVTLDGLYLFYTTERAGDAGYNPYWVSTQIIQDLRPGAHF